MKTRNLDGFNAGFEIENAAISRAAVVRILGSIPGVTVRRTPSRWRLFQEHLCAFELAGLGFEVTEADGDSSVYQIGPSSKQWASDPEAIMAMPGRIAIIRDAFQRHDPPRWVHPLRVVSWLLLVSGAAGLGVFAIGAPGWLGRTGILVLDVSVALFLLGGACLAAALVAARNFYAVRGADAGG